MMNMVDQLRAVAAMFRDIQAALGTEETGRALVEVARRAHEAEQKLARVSAALDESDDDSAVILEIMLILGRNDG